MDVHDVLLEDRIHPVWVRVAHWAAAIAFGVLVVSDVGVLLALPKLFWGEVGANDAVAWINLPLPINVDQTGWSRNLHFAAAWVFVVVGLLYLMANVAGGRFYRRLLLDRDQARLNVWAREARDHLAARRPARAEPIGRYGALQKTSYLVVILVLAPLMVLSGLTMSPGVTSAHPELFALFGGRQSARTVHFLTACLLVAFLIVHVWQVFANDPRKLMRAMTFGRSSRTEGRG